MLMCRGRPRVHPLALVLALLGPLSACDRTAADPVADAKTKPDSTKPDATKPAELGLALGEAKIMREGHADRPITITADGVVTLAGMAFGTVSSDGRFSNPEGELLMTVGEGGLVSGTDGPIGITLDATGGSLELPNLKVLIRFETDGVISVDASGANAGLLGTDSPQLRSEGCEGPMVRTCALVTLNYLRALGNPDSAQAI